MRRSKHVVSSVSICLRYEQSCRIERMVIDFNAALLTVLTAPWYSGLIP
jgi:hypothetical protein